MGIIRASTDITNSFIIPEGCVERFVPYLCSECVALAEAFIGPLGITDVVEGYVVTRKRPRMHELLFCLSGTGRLWSERTPPRSLQPGDLLIAPCNTEYSYRCEGAPWRIMWFHLENKALWHGLCSLPVHVRKSGFPHDLESTMTRLLTESMGQERQWSRITTLLAEMVVLYLQRELAMSDSPHERKVRQCLEDLWSRVDGRLDKNWTIRDLAAQANMSTSGFYRACERYMGLNPKKVLLKLRMQRAEELLLNYDYPLKIVAAMVGYESPFSFSNAFKRIKKISPKAYRAQALERGP